MLAPRPCSTGRGERRGPRKTPCPAKTAGQAGWTLSSRTLRWAIPYATLLGQMWSQWKLPQRGIAHSPDHTAKLILYTVKGGNGKVETKPSHIKARACIYPPIRKWQRGWPLSLAHRAHRPRFRISKRLPKQERRLRVILAGGYPFPLRVCPPIALAGLSRSELRCFVAQ